MARTPLVETFDLDPGAPRHDLGDREGSGGLAVDDDHVLEIGQHGPDFVATFCELAEAVMGPEVAHVLRVVYSKEGVQ